MTIRTTRDKKGKFIKGHKTNIGKKYPKATKKRVKSKVNKKARLRKEADKLWVYACLQKYGNKCEICGKPAQQIHHYFPKGSYGHLRYSLANGVPLCKGCHFRLHHADATLQEKIRDKRGEKWYSRLKSLANADMGSYQTISWYKGQISLLKRHIKGY